MGSGDDTRFLAAAVVAGGIFGGRARMWTAIAAALFVWPTSAGVGHSVEASSGRTAWFAKPATRRTQVFVTFRNAVPLIDSQPDS